MTNWWRILCFVFCILYFVCLFRNDKLMSYFVLHHLPSVSQVFRFLHPAPRLWTQRQTDTQTGRRQIKVYAEANFFIEMVNTPVLRVIFVFWVCWCFDRSSLRVTFLHFRSAHWCNSHTGLHMSKSTHVISRFFCFRVFLDLRTSDQTQIAISEWIRIVSIPVESIMSYCHVM